MKFKINPAYTQLTSFIQSLPDRFDSAGTVMYAGRNTIRKYETEGLSLVVKRFKKPNIINRFAYGTVRKSKARRSYEYAFLLAEKGINSPTPIAFIEQYCMGLGYSFYISLEAQEKYQIREFCKEETDVEKNRFILEAFGRFSAQLHELGILHRDYSSGNILFDVINEEPQFSLVDINRMNFRPIDEETGYRNLEGLRFPDKSYEIVARSYARSRGFDEEKALKKILYYKNDYIERRK